MAAGARLATYQQIADGPALHLHVWTESDMHFFDRWARAVMAGDWLTGADMRPYHSRHRELACRAITLEGGGECSEDAIVARWDRWLGRSTLWQDPGYPYLLAAIYAAVGREPPAVYAVHALVGIGSVVLVYLVTRMLFGGVAALAAGLLAALFGPAIHFETLRLRETLIVLAGFAACATLIRALRTRRRTTALAAGMAAGVGVLLKASAALWLAGVVVGTMLSRRSSLRTRAALSAALFTGAVLAFSPLAARNLAIGLAPWRVAATGPLNFLNGNAVDHSPQGGSAVSEHAVRILTKTDGSPPAVIRATIDTHPSVAHWLVTLVEKAAAFWRAEEVPNNGNYAYFVLQAPWLAWGAIEFWLVAALAVPGLLLAIGGGRTAWPLVLHVLSGLAVCIVFFNLSRFRLPVAVALIPFAGFTIARLSAAAAERELGQVAALAVAVVGLAVTIRANAPAEVLPARAADYGVHNEISVHLAGERAKTGDVAGALALVERQLATEPAALAAVEPGPDETVISRDLAEIAGTFVGLHRTAADLSARLGRHDRVAHHHRRARVLSLLGNLPARVAGE